MVCTPAKQQLEIRLCCHCIYPVPGLLYFRMYSKYILLFDRMPLEYSWQRVGKPMPAKVEFKDLNRVLVIKDAQFVDEGTYECHVRSTKGYDQKQFTFSLSGK